LLAAVPEFRDYSSGADWHCVMDVGLSGQHGGHVSERRWRSRGERMI
jgi:hypothetical protein